MKNKQLKSIQEWIPIKEIYENTPRRIKEPIVIYDNLVDECENEIIWIKCI